MHAGAKPRERHHERDGVFGHRLYAVFRGGAPQAVESQDCDGTGDYPVQGGGDTLAARILMAANSSTAVAAPTPAPTANADKEGVPATPEEKRKRGFAGMPVLPGGQSLAMPLDGFGLSYCCCCGQDAGFRSMMIAENDGLTISRSEERSFRSAARRFNMAVAKRASDAGRNDISRMLQVADWPGGEALQFFAEELGGSLLFGSCCDEDERLFGSGPIALHVYHDLTEPDPDGDSYDKFDLIQSWTLERTPRPGKIRSKRLHHSKLRTTSSSISRDRRPRRQSIASTTDARSKVPRDKNSMADRETPDAERFAASLAGNRRWKNAKRPHHAPVSRP